MKSPPDVQSPWIMYLPSFIIDILRHKMASHCSCSIHWDHWNPKPLNPTDSRSLAGAIKISTISVQISKSCSKSRFWLKFSKILFKNRGSIFSLISVEILENQVKILKYLESQAFWSKSRAFREKSLTFCWNLKYIGRNLKSIGSNYILNQNL